MLPCKSQVLEQRSRFSLKRALLACFSVRGTFPFYNEKLVFHQRGWRLCAHWDKHKNKQSFPLNNSQRRHNVASKLFHEIFMDHGEKRCQTSKIAADSYPAWFLPNRMERAQPNDESKRIFTLEKLVFWFYISRAGKKLSDFTSL